jgi:hypothetical protein
VPRVTCPYRPATEEPGTPAIFMYSRINPSTNVSECSGEHPQDRRPGTRHPFDSGQLPPTPEKLLSDPPDEAHSGVSTVPAQPSPEGLPLEGGPGAPRDWTNRRRRSHIITTASRLGDR